MSGYSGMDKEAREVLQEYDRLREVRTTSYHVPFTIREALRLADELADFLEAVLDGRCI